MEDDTARTIIAPVDQQVIVKVSCADISVLAALILTCLGLRRVSKEENQVRANSKGVRAVHQVSHPVPLYSYLAQENQSKAGWVRLLNNVYDLLLLTWL